MVEVRGKDKRLSGESWKVWDMERKVIRVLRLCERAYVSILCLYLVPFGSSVLYLHLPSSRSETSK